MSAIVGIYFLDGRVVDGAALQSMVEQLAHRAQTGQVSGVKKK